jgi:DNA-binding NtrC family response regulator
MFGLKLGLSEFPPFSQFSPAQPLEAASRTAYRQRPNSGARPARRQNESASGSRVLMFGKIRELALYRAEVLRAHGFTATIPSSKDEAIAAIRRGHFDVAVLTYTLSSDTVQELAEMVRQHCPGCPVITISNTHTRDTKIKPDANVIADDGPKALIDALRRTLRHM